LKREVFGLTFSNPVGLAAGFDKNAQFIDEFSSLGFGFIEIGTVTPKGQPGNPKPRLFRLKADEGLINRMGFNNHGVERAVKMLKQKKSNVIVGGNIGKNLAGRLEREHHVKIIERDPVRAEAIAEDLSKTIVLVGDCADENLLREESIENTDVYCVLTNDDEANIMSSLLAKRMGAKKVIAIINRPSYVDLMESGTIDIAVSPQLVTIGSLLTHIRRGDVVVVHSLRRGAAEAIEAVALGDKRNSRVVGRTVEEIDLPEEDLLSSEEAERLLAEAPLPQSPPEGGNPLL
jgi:Trk K+ transport system NAD-binding subunit